MNLVYSPNFNLVLYPVIDLTKIFTLGGTPVKLLSPVLCVQWASLAPFISNVWTQASRSTAGAHSVLFGMPGGVLRKDARYTKHIQLASATCAYGNSTRRRRR
ncbi:hypothetical protein CBL_11914 [Carabus blaptoides fortunei]